MFGLVMVVSFTKIVVIKLVYLNRWCSYLEKKSTSKILQLTAKYNLVDIWRITKSTTNRSTFRQNHSSGFIQRRLDYVFVTNSLQESIQKTNILPSFAAIIRHSYFFTTAIHFLI